MRRADYALDDAALKPYFPLARVQQAAFDVAQRLFGITLTEAPDMPVYHPDVRAYEVRDADGHVGVFLADHFARPDKRSGAWMSSYRDQENLDEAVSPVIVNNNNFAAWDADAAVVRRWPYAVPRVRPCAAWFAEPGALPGAVGHRGAA